MSQNQFLPDYAVPPGATLHDVLDERGISQVNLAMRTGLTKKTISQIVNGVAPITYDTAEKLELALGVPATFWNSRESHYRETLLRIEQESKLKSATDWLRSIPVKDLVQRQFIPEVADKGTLARLVLKFFGVSSLEAWNEVWVQPQVQFRGAKALDSKPGFIAAWVRMAEMAAEAVACKPYDPVKFRGSIKEARKLTRLSLRDWSRKVGELFSESGVAFVMVKEIDSASVSGIAKWLLPDKAMIALSLKYKRDDQVWFSLFHECCHILKHSKKDVFYENGKSAASQLEKEADGFARDILIPPEDAKALPSLPRSRDAIRRFASEIGVAPGIVLGRMQFDNLIPRGWCQDLRTKYAWG